MSLHPDSFAEKILVELKERCLESAPVILFNWVLDFPQEQSAKEACNELRTQGYSPETPFKTSSVSSAPWCCRFRHALQPEFAALRDFGTYLIDFAHRYQGQFQGTGTNDEPNRRCFDMLFPKQPGVLLPMKVFDCLCCQYPTISSPGDFIICSICNWEDDRNMGANGSLTLRRARANFRAHGSIYDLAQLADQRARGIPVDNGIQYSKSMITLLERFISTADLNERGIIFHTFSEM